MAESDLAAPANIVLPPTGRNIVVCCDGTGNEVSGDLSNILKLYRIAMRNERQIVYYNPGVGTLGLRKDWGRLIQNARGVFGLATGYGLDANIMDAYQFVCRNHQPGDRLFLFGFSRGAYTVRALAGMVRMIGLLRPEQFNLASYALTAYKRSSEENDLYLAWDFARIVEGRHATIHFLGAWDTVASMIVPRPDRFYLPSLRTLPYTRKNASVRCFRHAVAIDERRRMFRLNRWEGGQFYEPAPFADPASKEKQDSVEMAFAGVHADVGGGYPEVDSALSKFPLAWMIGEAAGQGLQIRPQMYEHLVLGKQRAGGRHVYVAPNAAGPLHNSLNWAWWIIEFLPKQVKWQEWTRPSFADWYLPRGEPRKLPDGIGIHPSVRERQRRVPDYQPVNL